MIQAEIYVDKFWQFSKALFDKQKDFFDANVVSETRNKTYERLSKVAGSVGIDEKAPKVLSDGIQRVYGFDPPREHGHNAVEAMFGVLDAADGSVNKQGRRLTDRACDQCKQRKIRCSSSNERSCESCTAKGISCTYLLDRKKRGPPSKRLLPQRIEQNTVSKPRDRSGLGSVWGIRLSSCSRDKNFGRRSRRVGALTSISPKSQLDENT